MSLLVLLTSYSFVSFVINSDVVFTYKTFITWFIRKVIQEVMIRHLKSTKRNPLLGYFFKAWIIQNIGLGLNHAKHRFPVVLCTHFFFVVPNTTSVRLKEMERYFDLKAIWIHKGISWFLLYFVMQRSAFHKIRWNKPLIWQSQFS